MSDSKYAVFHLSGKSCALPVEEVREILPTVELLRPPRIPSLLAGFLNLGGRAVPVLRLDRLLGLAEHEPGPYTHVMMLQDGRRSLAFLVERVTSIAALPAHELLSVKPADSFNGCATGAALVDGQTVHLLAFSKLLLEQERAAVAEFAQLAQDRLDGVQGGVA